jgi:hypothetical protein
VYITKADSPLNLAIQGMPLLTFRTQLQQKEKSRQSSICRNKREDSAQQCNDHTLHSKR